MRIVFKTLFFIFTFFTLQTVFADELNKVVAIVNDQVITQNELDQQIAMAKQAIPPNSPLPADLKTKVLQHLIDTKLQLQLAKRVGIKVSNSDVDQAINDIAARNHLTASQLKQKLAEQNLSYADYRNEIYQEVLISRLEQQQIAPHIKVTDQNVKDFLTLHHNTIPSQGPMLFLVYDVIVPIPEQPTSTEIANAQKTAANLLLQAKAGNTLEKIAKNAALPGNNLGWQPLTGLPDLFEPVVAKMQKNETQIVRAPNGFHVLQLLNTQGGAVVSNTVTETHARHILIKTNPLTTDDQIKQRLEQLRTRVVDGADFATLAKENSQDPGSISKGGDLGWTMPGMLDPVFQAQMDMLQPNQVSQPFKTQFGWHIVQVLERKTTVNQDALKQAARQAVYEQKFQEELNRWLQQLRSEGYVKVL